ncbi:MAG TPA: hypothetical protein VMU04_25200 [Candidatus Acidoferrum sp.]|nr:hypothetical protein [Candidatus Acidoferrum sp.]
MRANLQLAVALVVYGLGPILVLVGGYFGWKRIRPHCRRYGANTYHARVAERKKFWGYE